MISVSEARSRVLAAAPYPRTEIVMLKEAGGRTLSSPLTARRTQPPADVSAMDGYAVRSEDFLKAPTRLSVIGEAPAGSPFNGTVGPGETVRIFTGGELPLGADTVILQEDTARDGATAIFSELPVAGRHIRKAGLDFQVGDTIIPSGMVLTPRHLALAASMNILWARVSRKPRVAILATGDEIRLPGDDIGPGQIIGSSGVGVASYVDQVGGEAILLDIAGDTEHQLTSAARQAVGADILVTLGGASVGDHDLVQQALTKEGLNVGFWKIAMRPGKPLMFGNLGEQIVLGLPGNPVSTMVCAILFLGPLIKRMLGQAETNPRILPARLKTPIAPNDRREDYIRANLTLEGNGFEVEAFAIQDSSMMSIFAKSNCLIVRPPHMEAVPAGSVVDVLPLDIQF
jgi:molybdopterin molybdotransferase